MKFVNAVRSFIRNEEGQDLLEYALLVALIAVVAAASVGLAGGKVKGAFDAIVAEFPGAGN
jgi:pilus assembly protein Flp/PilA